MFLNHPKSVKPIAEDFILVKKYTQPISAVLTLLITAFLSTEDESAQGCFALIAINARSCSLPSFLVHSRRQSLAIRDRRSATASMRERRGKPQRKEGRKERHRNPPPLNKLARKNNGNNFPNTSREQGACFQVRGVADGESLC